MPDDGPMISNRELTAARVLLGWSHDDLARASGVTKTEIAQLEATADSFGEWDVTLAKVVGAMEHAGIAFIANGDVVGGGSGVRFKSGRSIKAQ
jgi:predicted transcriptional regulator